MYSSVLAVFRFDAKAHGEIAIPCALVAKEPMKWPAKAPKDAEWIWTDGDGDGRIDPDEYERGDGFPDRYLWGWSIDRDGTVRQALNEKGVRTLPRTKGLQNGVPRWSLRDAPTVPLPAPFVNIQRAEYDVATDTMLLSGYTNENPNDGRYWKIVGREIALYEGWSRGGRTPKWRLVPPWRQDKEPKQSAASFCVAGPWLFTVDVLSAVVTVYERSTGRAVGRIAPGPEVGKRSGWVDIPYGIEAFVRKDGEVVVIVEEDERAKTMLYRWHPKTGTASR